MVSKRLYRMTDSGERQRRWLSLVLHDAHFWVPVAVLIAGLIVLRCIS
jgi:hypothetical protein